jgi:hypothetical protein
VVAARRDKKAGRSGGEKQKAEQLVPLSNLARRCALKARRTFLFMQVLLRSRSRRSVRPLTSLTQMAQAPSMPRSSRLPCGERVGPDAVYLHTCRFIKHGGSGSCTHNDVFCSHKATSAAELC